MRFLRTFLLILVVSLAGCASVTSNLSDDVSMRVYSANLRDDGYSVRLRFTNESDMPALCQEVQIMSSRGDISLVEVFQGRFGLEIDRHYAMWDTKFQEQRVMSVYPCRVEGADWTNHGFAHLPENMDGSVRTRIRKNFNRDYTDDHETRGRIVEEDRKAVGNWALRYDGFLMNLIVEMPSGRIVIDRKSAYYESRNGERRELNSRLFGYRIGL